MAYDTEPVAEDMSDMEIIESLIEDYGMEPTDTIADLIEAIREGEDNA